MRSTCLPMQRSLGASLLFLGALAACQPVQPVPSAMISPRPDVRPVVYEHAVRFSGATVTMPPSEARQLQDFFASLPPHRAMTARVVAVGSGNPRVDLARSRAVEEALETLDGGPVLALERVPPGGARANDQTNPNSGDILVELHTHEVVLPGCPDWSRDLAFDARNLPMPNLGCANAVNLGLMIADPSDLVRTGRLDPADGTREAEALVRYRTDKVKQPEADAFQP